MKVLEPDQIIAKMLERDAFSQWLGVRVEDIKAGQCTLSMVIRDEMLNGFLIGHGGISFSFADCALAFASNSRGRHAVSVETSITHHKPLQEGDHIFAKTKEIHLSNKLGTYLVEVTKASHELVATFKGTVYRTSRVWETI